MPLVRVFELAFACRVYGGLTRFDDALADLREVTGATVDPADADERRELLSFLRRWGCQHVAERDQAIAAASLEQWWAEWGNRLPAADRTLEQLTDDDLEVIGQAYADLAARQASRQVYSDGTEVRKTFGPSGAAKTMFAVRPNACSPWDRAIREHFGYKGTAADYRAHLLHAREEISEAASELESGDAADLPGLVGRPLSSPAKLSDEFDWVVRSKGIPPPSIEELSSLARLAGLLE